METEIFSAEPANNTSKPPLLKAWICFALVSTIGGFLAGLIAGIFFGGFLGMAGIPIPQIQLYCGILGFLIGLPISFLSFRWSVNKFILEK